MSRPCTYAGGDSAETVGAESSSVVDTAGKDASRIAEYIANQLKEDESGEQLTMSELGPFTSGK